MGLIWSKRNRHRLDHQNPNSTPQPPPPHPYSTPPPPPRQPYNTLPPPPPPVFQFPQPPPYPTSSDQFSFPPIIPPRPPQQPHHYSYCYNNNYPNYYGRPPNYYNFNYMPQISGWAPRPGQPAAPLPPPPSQPAPYVDHKNAKKIKNDVNVHRDTISLQLDVLSTDSHLVCFTFDAMVDGSITILYFAKEGDQCTFTPLYPEIVPVKIPFQKGLGQKFCQPSGTGVDLGFFDTDDLSKPIPGEDVYPLVISMESFGPSALMHEPSNGKLVNTLPSAQISQAVLEKKSDGNFQVKVIKQILWVDGERYELREIFGLSQSDETTANNMDSEKDCVICMTEVKNTAVLPCRHMCMCSECAKELRLQSDKCPVCRQPIEKLLEIKVDEEAGV